MTTSFGPPRKCAYLNLRPSCGGRKEIMKHEGQVSIPYLKTNNGVWVLDAQGKANLFGDAAKTERLHRVSPVPGESRIFCFPVRKTMSRHSREPQ